MSTEQGQLALAKRNIALSTGYGSRKRDTKRRQRTDLPYCCGCNVLQAHSWRKGNALISCQLTSDAAVEFHRVLFSVCALMYMQAHACVHASMHTQERGRGNVSPICRTGKTGWILQQLVGLCNKPRIYDFWSSYQEGNDLRGFCHHPLGNGN